MTMRKLIPFLFSGLAALSLGAMAADAEKNVTTGPNAGAEAKGDANPGASTASDNAKSEKRDEPQGTAKDSHQTHPKPGKQAERKKDEAGAGATTGDRKY
jgi:hypothetical protein